MMAAFVLTCLHKSAKDLANEGYTPVLAEFCIFTAHSSYNISCHTLATTLWVAGEH